MLDFDFAPPGQVRRFGWFYHLLGWDALRRIRIDDISADRLRVLATDGPVVYDIRGPCNALLTARGSQPTSAAILANRALTPRLSWRLR